MNFFELLSNNAYPGRGLIVGYHNKEKVIAYFIMGRSDNSRNRVFRKENDILFTKAYDETKVKDPSLIIYNALREFKDYTIVTNGDQTDTIYNFLNDGKSFKEALETRQYEPDEPNYTPRISALINNDSYTISILKKVNEECERDFYDYKLEDNKAHFISTYDCDGNPLPSFSKEPIGLNVEMEFDEFADKLWNSLNSENKISLFVRFGNKEKIFNKNEAE